MGKNARKTSIILLIVFSIIVIAGITILWTKKPSPLPSDTNTIAKIGDITITQTDISKKIQAESCYGTGEKISETVALKLLIEDSLELVILTETYPELVPSPEKIREQSDWIDRTNTAPDLVYCIKEAYGSGSEYYFRSHIAPSMINPKLHAAFSIDQTIHAGEREKIQGIREQVLKGAKLESLPDYKEIDIKSDTPIAEKIFKDMKIGETTKNIVEDDYSYGMYTIIKKKDDTYTVGSVVVVKTSFDDWFKKSVNEKLIINISQEDILTKLKQEFPDIYWLTIAKIGNTY